MFKLKEKKRDVYSFEMRKDKLLYISRQKSLYFDDILIKEENVCCFTYGLEEFVIFSSLNSDIYIYVNNKVSLLLEGYSLSEKKYGESKVIISKRVSRGVFHKYVFDLKTSSILNEIKSEPAFKYSNFEIYQFDITLKSLSLLTGEYEWEIDLSEYGEIRSVLAAVQDNLWVLANDYKNNRHSLLRLDANSGRVMQVLGEGLKLSDAHVQYIEEKQTLLSLKSSISSVPSPSTLIEIDAKTGEVLRNVKVDSVLEPNLKVGLWQYHNNQLFFTANTTMMTTTHIGVLDYDTLELLWYTEVPDRKGLLKDIQVSTDKIYVLDQVGTLHIFEKESD